MADSCPHYTNCCAGGSSSSSSSSHCRCDGGPWLAKQMPSLVIDASWKGGGWDCCHHRPSRCRTQQLSTRRLLLSLLPLSVVLGPAAVDANFVTSLHSSFVVNLDFGDSEAEAALSPTGGDGTGDDAAPSPSEASDDVKVMSFAGGGQKFKCSIPSTRNQTKPSLSGSEDIAAIKARFIAAKLAMLQGECWKHRKDFWTYDVCFGRRISQYQAGGDLQYSLGDHVPEADELSPSGEVKQHYIGGAGNRSAEVHYACGSSEASSREFSVEEDRPLHYKFRVSGPTFCSWNLNNGATSQDASGRSWPVSALLEEMRGTCVNTTQGWWTYEYCFPHSLIQFHLAGNGKTRDPTHILGTLNGTTSPTAPNTVKMETIRLKPSISPRERREPPSNHLTLQQYLGGGTVCDETSQPRSTKMRFQCPLKWKSQTETQIVSIQEGSLCEYEVVIQSPMLCGHSKFLPTIPMGKQTIQCTAEN